MIANYLICTTVYNHDSKPSHTYRYTKNFEGTSAREYVSTTLQNKHIAKMIEGKCFTYVRPRASDSRTTTATEYATSTS